MDNEDAASRDAVEALGYQVLVTETLMIEDTHKIALSTAVCKMAGVSV